MKNKKTLFIHQWIFKAIAVCCCLLLIIGCDDDEKKGSTSPAFQTYMPVNGVKGSEIAIWGYNFGEDASKVKVWINEKEARIIDMSNSTIKVEVPTAAGTGDVKIQIDGAEEYTYPTPFTYQFTRTVGTLAGTGEFGNNDGTLEEATFQNPIWLAYDKKEDATFVLEDYDKKVRRVKDGKVETLVRFGGAIGNVKSLAFSITGDTLFVANDVPADAGNVAIAILLRKDDFKVLKPYLLYPAAKESFLTYVGVHPINGSVIYCSYLSKFFKVNKNTLEGELLYDITETPKNNVGVMQFAPDGKTLYYISQVGYQGLLNIGYDIEKNTTVGQLKHFVGNGEPGHVDGQGVNARVDQPYQAATDEAGNLYLAEKFGPCIRKITPEGQVSVYAGQGWQFGYLDGEASSAKFDQPQGIIRNNDGHFIVAETYNQRLRIIKEE